MGMNTSLSRLPDDAFALPQARHLLRRAAFGPEPTKLAQGPTAARELVALGLDAAVDRLVHYHAIPADHLPEPDINPDLLRPYTAEERRERAQARRLGDQATLDRITADRLRRLDEDRQTFRQLQQWWVQIMLRTPRPLEENLTLLWHDHFATRHRNVRNSYHMFQQNAMLRRHACGSFADLALGIVHDPAMLRFLNNDQNRQARPNENLARELLELFTLGVGNYAEQDIQEAARALTGYHVNHNDFHFNRRQHDPGPKVILGRRANFDGESLVLHLLRQNACATFVAYKLYRHFVADVVPDHATAAQIAVIRRLAVLVRRHEYRLAPVLKALFKSQHFYDPAIVGKKIKSPVQLLASTVRMMHTPARQPGQLHRSLRELGQELFDPPSVAGWDGGRAWVNTSTLFTRQNLSLYLLTGYSSFAGSVTHRQRYDPMPLLAELPADQRTPARVVDELVNQLVGDHIPPDRRLPLVHELQQRIGADGQVNADALVPLLVLITAMPEYQLC